MIDAGSSVSGFEVLEPAHVVGTGGAIGAVLRHWVTTRLEAERTAFPRGTLAVNVVGSFVLGLAIFAGAGETTMQLLGVGICGAFTTFSTFSVETVRLWEDGDRRLAVANAVVRSRSRWQAWDWPGCSSPSAGRERRGNPRLHLGGPEAVGGL